MISSPARPGRTRFACSNAGPCSAAAFRPCAQHAVAATPGASPDRRADGRCAPRAPGGIFALSLPCQGRREVPVVVFKHFAHARERRAETLLRVRDVIEVDAVIHRVVHEFLRNGPPQSRSRPAMCRSPPWSGTGTPNSAALATSASRRSIWPAMYSRQSPK